jgi:hypothetical protein
MTWSTVLALFYFGAAMPIAWHRFCDIVDRLAPGSI